MKKQVISASLTFVLIFISLAVFAQVGINTDGSQPDPSAMLDVKSAARGFLPPRVALTSADVASPVQSPVATGLLVFNTATNGTSTNKVVPGYYYWSGSRWVAVATPQGVNPGEMLFWDGYSWVTIPRGNHGQQLYFCNGIPTWGGCFALLNASPVSNVNANSVVAGGSVISDGGSPVVGRGVCWSTSPNPTVSDNSASMGTGEGVFSGQISGLIPQTTYFLRAYATNNAGTIYTYGNDSTFTTADQDNAPVTSLPIISSCPGAAVNIPVKVNAFANIGNVMLTLHYSPSVLTFTGATNTSGFSGLTIDGSEPGVIIISGTASPGVTFPDNTVLATIHCTFISGSTGLTWYDNGNSCEYRSGDLALLNDLPATTYYLNGQVNEASAVGTPVFNAGATSSRCQGPGSVAYPATASNSTGITYSLDALSIVAGNTINPTSGTVTYTADWVGTSVITATAQDCSGPKTAIHTATINQVLPVSISITVPGSTVCEGTSVTFSATAINGGTQPAYQWQVNGINAGTNSNSFSYVPSNNDVVKCILSSSEDCVSGNPATSNIISMTVNPLLPVSVSIAASANPACAGTTVTFSATPVNGGIQPAYQWKVGGVTISGATNATYDYTPANGDIVTVVLTSGESCTSSNPAESNAVTMTINPVLPVSVSIETLTNPVCEGATVNFTATAIHGGLAPVYQWKVNNINTGPNANTFTYSPSNGDVVSCMLTSSEGCASGNPAISNLVSMTVSPLLPVSNSIAASANPVCAGTSVTYTATPVNGGTTPVFQWRVNGTDVQGATDAVYGFVPENTNVITCILTSNETCASGNPATSNSLTMTVIPVVPDSVNITASSNPVCFGTSVTFTAHPVYVGTNPVFQWKVNGNNSGSNNPVFQYSPETGDAISCVLTSDATCSAGIPATSNTISMTVNPLLPVEITISASANDICAGTSVTFTATPLNGGASPAYQWKVGGSPVAGATNATYNYTPDNGDMVTAVLTSTETCTTGNPATSNSISMTVNPSFAVGVSIAASANPVVSSTPVTYTATPVNGGTTPIYQWKVNSSNAGTNDPIFIHTPIHGDQVSCVLTSDVSCATTNPAISNTITMVVNDILPVSVSIAASGNPVCAGTEVTFTATPVNGGTNPSYQWMVGGTTISGATNVTYSYLPVNGEIITCVLTSSEPFTSGNPATSNPIAMIVNPSLPVSVSVEASASNICSGTSVTFTATPVNGGTTPAYQWKVNGANAGTNNPEFVYTPAPGDQVTCVLTSNANCAAGNPANSNTVAITVNLPQAVSVSISASVNPSCSGASVTFTAIPVNGGTTPAFQWKVGGNPVTGATNPTYAYVPANNDAVTCLLTSSESCTTGNPATSNAIQASVLANVTASVSIAASANPSCAGTAVSFTATPVNGGTTPVYQWKVNGNNAGTNNAVYSYNPVNGDVVTCQMTSNANCVTGSPATSNAIAMTVNPVVAVSASIVASVYAVMPGTSVTFTATVVNGGTTPTYQWKVNSGNVGTNSNTYTYTPADHDKVTCVVTSSLTGCLSGNPATSNAITMVVYTTGTPCTGIPTVSHGGLTYNTVQIGTQCWLRESLNIGNRVNGTVTQANNGIIEKYCYGDNEMNCNVYGGLYQWAEVVQYQNNATNTTNWSPVPTGNVKGICPDGWHIPTNAEWGVLMTNQGGQGVTGGKIKEATLAHFITPNASATNSSGFTALGAGQRYSTGAFYYIKEEVSYWTISPGANANTDVYYGGASYAISPATNGQFYKVTGISVRCLKD